MNASDTSWAGALIGWVANYYLAATLLLGLTLAGWRWIRQPAHRLLVAWIVMLELLVLAVVCALPFWPRISLLAPTPPAAALVAEDRDFVSEQRIVWTPETALDNHRWENNDTVAPAPVPAVQPPPQRGFLHLLGLGEIRWTWIETIAVGYLGGAALIGFWLCWGALATMWMSKLARPAEDLLRMELAQIVGDNGRAPRLLTSPRIVNAVAMGVWRPTIVLPADLAQNGPSQTLRAVLSHEWAHIRNRDLCLLALGRCLLAVLFAHPLFWWLRRTIRGDQEVLADAVAAGANRHDYAEELLRLIRKTARPSSIAASAAMGIWEGPSQLSRRIVMLLDETFHVEPTGSRRWKYRALVVLVLLGAACSMLTLQPAQSADKPAQAASIAEAKTESKAGHNNDKPTETTTTPDKAQAEKPSLFERSIIDLKVNNAISDPGNLPFPAIYNRYPHVTGIYRANVMIAKKYTKTKNKLVVNPKPEVDMLLEQKKGSEGGGVTMPWRAPALKPAASYTLKPAIDSYLGETDQFNVGSATKLVRKGDVLRGAWKTQKFTQILSATQEQPKPEDAAESKPEKKTDLPYVERSATYTANVGIIKSEEHESVPIALPGYWLLTQPSVVKELNITAEQKEKLRAISAKYHSVDVPKFFEESRKYQPTDESSKILAQRVQELRKNIQKQVEAILTPQQLQSLKELTLHNNAFNYLGSPNIFEILSLTTEQKDNLRLIRNEANDRLAKRSEETTDALLAVLDPQQRAQLREAALGPVDTGFRKLRGVEVEGKILLVPEASLSPYPDVGEAAVQEKLGLGAEQREQVKKLLGDYPNLADKLAHEADKLMPQKKDLQQGSTVTMQWRARTSAEATTAKPSEEELKKQQAEFKEKLKKEREQRQAEYEKHPLAKISIELRKPFEELLTPEQLAVYKDMAVRKILSVALGDRLVLDQIDVSAQQMTAIARIKAEYVEDSRKFGRKMGGKMLKILTPSQKEKLQEEVDRFPSL